MAAKDPDQELRILVVKALEKLKSPKEEKFRMNCGKTRTGGSAVIPIGPLKH
jgi:hypothetical protein